MSLPSPVPLRCQPAAGHAGQPCELKPPAFQCRCLHVHVNCSCEYMADGVDALRSMLAKVLCILVSIPARALKGKGQRHLLRQVWNMFLPDLMSDSSMV